MKLYPVPKGAVFIPTDYGHRYHLRLRWHGYRDSTYLMGPSARSLETTMKVVLLRRFWRYLGAL